MNGSEHAFEKEIAETREFLFIMKAIHRHADPHVKKRLMLRAREAKERGDVKPRFDFAQVCEKLQRKKEGWYE